MAFVLDREAIFNHPRVTLIEDTNLIDIHKQLDDIERFINIIYNDSDKQSLGLSPVQSGRVIALRVTDEHRHSSAFKSAMYLGKYHDMANVRRFLDYMVKAGHSYEPIRGEFVLFLFIGIGKPVYDHLVTYTTGRPTRIAGGQRANLPWGYEVPAEIKQGGATDLLIKEGYEQVERIIRIVKGTDEEQLKQQMQVARSLLPVGYVMPPFLLEFSEEALVKNVFKQRLWEPGAQGATVDVVMDMWNCMMKIDKNKWETFADYHGPHTLAWEKAMRTIRDKKMTISDFLDVCVESGWLTKDKENIDLTNAPLYELMMNTVGKLPQSMWEKSK